MVDQSGGYSSIAVEAARAVMLELVHLLKEHRDKFVIVGGWVPELLFTNAEPPHLGSTDVDLALRRDQEGRLSDPSIRELLLSRGYVKSDRSYTLQRTVTVRGRAVTVDVDFLTSARQQDHRRDPSLEVQVGTARETRGCNLAFEMSQPVKIEGIRPDGVPDSSVVRVADIVPLLVMKGLALADRKLPKDYYDIYFCIKNYPGGLDALVVEFSTFAQDALVREALANIRAAFESPYIHGPVFVASAEELSDPEERDIRERDAYERINAFLDELGIV
ncbi:MAG: nucleotidyl transferase AbiEii/AbiGii toxin family protein [Phycisphaerae bacterium]|nr:nucleotidyl transferase AbiEii/AbiGii toxin family protein [Phycisphaerae bacterium]